MSYSKIILGFIIALVITLTSCVKEEIFTPPENLFTTYELKPTTTVVKIKNMATGVPIVCATDEVVEAYVTSSDEKGNFFKIITFQTLSEKDTPPIGFSVLVNATTLYGKGFIPGRKVYIKLKGLYYAMVNGVLQIGSLSDAGIGRVSEFEWQKHLFPSAAIVSEESLVRTLSLEKAFADENQSTLIELDAVEFADSSLNRTYYDSDSGGGGTDHILVSKNVSLEPIIRFSKYCPFTGKPVPSGSGKIRGVLMKYGPEFQFMVRYENDIKLTLPRFDAYPPVGGANLEYYAKLNLSFTNYDVGTTVFPNFINDAVIGSRYWKVVKSGSNKCLQMTSFGGKPEVNRSLFIIPVDFTAAKSFSFKTKSGYDNGTPLKVYYSLDYVPGGNISKCTLKDITAFFSIPSGPTSGYSSSFSASGTYNIPETLLGKGCFILEYCGNGNGGITTTLQVDSVVIK